MQSIGCSVGGECVPGSVIIYWVGVGGNGVGGYGVGYDHVARICCWEMSRRMMDAMRMTVSPVVVWCSGISNKRTLCKGRFRVSC